MVSAAAVHLTRWLAGFQASKLRKLRGAVCDGHDEIDFVLLAHQLLNLISKFAEVPIRLRLPRPWQS